MKKYLQAVVGLAALFFALAPVAASAQTTVTRQPQFVGNQAWLDIGNGPYVVVPLAGNGDLYPSLGTGVGSTSGSSTTLTLTTSAAANAPCVGCVISGTGITAGTTVAAFNGTTTVTLSAAMTVAASTALSWGMACPTSGQPPSRLGAPTELRAGSGIPQMVPAYTYARLCAFGAGQGGLTFSNFAWRNW